MIAKVLILCDENDVIHLDTSRSSKEWSISWLVFNFEKIEKMLPSIRKEIQRQGTDFVVFSRNDQVANRIRIGPVIRKLRIGYSSISGIDEVDRISQMTDCFSAFMDCNQHFHYEKSIQSNDIQNEFGNGTFTLIFDVEQVGCIRFGLQRILNLLDKYEATSTFFLTDIMNRICPNLVPLLIENMHEVGIHGKWHEYLSNYETDVQSKYIGETKADLGCQIHGANFAYRMNSDTIDALIENKIDYFVSPMINSYRFYHYPKISTSPGIISSSKGEILMMPISVETYGKPWLAIKNMIDSAYSISQKQGKHITIMCHPFRDGNARNILKTEKMIEYLINAKKMKPITLKNLKDHAYDEYSKNRIEFQDDFSTTGRISHRMTALDLAGLLPENAMLLWRLIHYPHGVW